jgi:hypothetical protein
MTSYEADDKGSNSRWDLGMFLSPQCPKELWISLKTTHLVPKASSTDRVEWVWQCPLILIHCKDLQYVEFYLHVPYTSSCHTAQVQRQLLVGADLDDLKNYVSLKAPQHWECRSESCLPHACIWHFSVLCYAANEVKSLRWAHPIHRILPNLYIILNQNRPTVEEQLFGTRDQGKYT